MPMPLLDKEARQLINKARTLGSDGLSIYLEDHTLMRICAVVANDLDQRQLVANIEVDAELDHGHYTSSCP